jgi:hypothetical protein
MQSDFSGDHESEFYWLDSDPDLSNFRFGPAWFYPSPSFLAIPVSGIFVHPDL